MFTELTVSEAASVSGGFLNQTVVQVTPVVASPTLNINRTTQTGIATAIAAGFNNGSSVGVSQSNQTLQTGNQVNPQAVPLTLG